MDKGESPASSGPRVRAVVNWFGITGVRNVIQAEADTTHQRLLPYGFQESLEKNLSVEEQQDDFNKLREAYLNPQKGDLVKFNDVSHCTVLMNN